MVFSRDDLRNQLKRREIAPVYVLFGAETYVRDIAARTIADLSFGEGDLRDFNETEFSLNADDNLMQALAAAEQLPMMASRRVVRVNEVRVSATGFRDTLKEEHETALAAYFANPSPTSVLIFVADELNGVRKMGKFLRANTIAVEFEPMRDDALLKWAREKIREVGATASDPVIAQLVSLVGPDARRLTNEVNKLAAAALPGDLISAELVAALVPDSREISNFAFTDHLVGGRRAEALTALKKILDDGAEPLALLGSIAYNYRRLLMAKSLMMNGVDRREVANAVKLRYNDQESFLAAARRADLADLTRAMQRIAETDLAIKTSKGGSSPLGPRMQIEVLVCDLAAN